MAEQNLDKYFIFDNFEKSDDWTPFFAYFRSVDITKSLGGNRKGDPYGKG